MGNNGCIQDVSVEVPPADISRLSLCVRHRTRIEQNPELILD